MKLETVYRCYTDDPLSNFIPVRSAVYVGVVSNGIIFIYLKDFSFFYSSTPSGIDASALIL